MEIGSRMTYFRRSCFCSRRLYVFKGWNKHAFNFYPMLNLWNCFVSNKKIYLKKELLS